MNMKTFARFRVTIVAAVSLLLAGESPTLCAATYTWDANGGTTGPQDGAGTWNTTLQNWWDGAQNIAWPDPNTADIARFGAGSGAAGTVTVEAVQANGLTFGSPGSGGYTLSSGTITLGGSSPTITTSVNATIQSSLAGSGFTKSGASQLTLSGALANTFTGTTTVSQGALSLAKSAGVAAISGDLVVNSGYVITSNGGSTNQFSATSNVSVTGNATINYNDSNSVAQTVNNVTHTSTALSNLTSWTISGTLAMSSGTISLGGLNTSMTIGTGSMTGGQLFIWGFTNSSTNTVNIGSGGLSMANASIRLGGTSGGTPSSGTPTLSLAGNYTGSGTNSIFRGSGNATARVDLGSATRTFTISGGTTTIDTGVSVIGTGGLTKAGAGLLVLKGSNTFSGDTLVNSGTLQLGNALALQNSVLDTSGAGVVGLSGPTTLTLGGLKGSTALASEIASGYPGLTSLTLNVASGTSVTYAGAIADGVAGMSLTKLGSGTQVLSGSNSYSGGTQINAGILAVGNAGALGSTGTISFGGGTLQFSDSNTTDYSSRFSTATNQAYALDTNGQNVTLATPLASSGGALTKLGSGTLTLSGSNSYSGGTQINAGVLALGNAGALGSTGTISFGGGTLQFSASNTTDYSNRFSTAANQAFRLDTNGQNVALATALSGSGSSLTKLGSGTLTLSASNSYTGGTQLNAGTLVFGNFNALGTGTVTLAGGVLQSGTGGTLSNALNITATSGTFDSQGNSNTLSGVIRGTGGLVKLGSGTLTLSGAAANTYSGTTTFNAGAISLSKNANVVAVPGDLVVNGGNVVLGAVGQFASTSNLFVNNAGTVNAGEVSNAQTVANVTYNSTAMSGLSGWTVTGTLAVASGQITFNTNQSGSFGAITMTGGSLMPYANGFPTTINVGSGGLSMTNALIQYGTSAYNGAGTGKVVLGGDFTGSGTNRLYKGNTNQISQLDLGSATRTFTITDGTTTIDTGVSVIGSGGLTKAGAGTLALSASNSYSGGTQINAGVVALGNAGALGSTGTISFGGGTLRFSASNTTDYSSRFSTAAGQAYGLDTNGQNITLAGALTSPGGSLTKSGAGRLTLNGANTFSGNTVISGGTLALGSAASLASTFIKAGNAAGDGGVLDVTALGSGLSVAGGQKLGGYGTVLGNVAIAGGAIVAPGGSIGALTESGTMTWGGGGRYLFEITNANGDGSYAGSRWDLLTVTNLLITATSSNPFIVDVQSLTNAGDGAAGLLSAGNWDPDTSYQWKFLVATNTTFSDANFSTNWFTVNSGSFLNATSGLFSVARGGAGGLGGSTTSNELYVVYAAVPEPAALSLAGIGAGLAGWLLWKRRHRRGSR